MIPPHVRSHWYKNCAFQCSAFDFVFKLCNNKQNITFESWKDISLVLFAHFNTRNSYLRAAIWHPLYLFVKTIAKNSVESVPVFQYNAMAIILLLTSLQWHQVGIFRQLRLAPFFDCSESETSVGERRLISPTLDDFMVNTGEKWTFEKRLGNSQCTHVSPARESS